MKSQVVKWNGQGKFGGFFTVVENRETKREIRCELKRKEHYILAILHEVTYENSYTKNFKLVDKSTYRDYKAAKIKAEKDILEFLKTGDLL